MLVPVMTLGLKVKTVQFMDKNQVFTGSMDDGLAATP